MDLIILVLVMAVVGTIVWVISERVPDPTLRLAIRLFTALVLLLYALRSIHVIPNVL